MIETLINGKEGSAFVVIKDNLSAPGENLLRCWCQGLSQRIDIVASLHCGTTSKFGCENFEIDCLGDLQHDADPSSLADVLTQIQSHPLFPTHDASLTSSQSPPPSISFLVPDLDSLFLFFAPSSVLRFLDRLLHLRPNVTVVGLLHRDCFPASLMPSLDYITRTSVTLHPAPPHSSGSFSSSLSSSQTSLSYLADVSHKKPSGKVILCRELIRLSASPPRFLDAIDVSKLAPKDVSPAKEASSMTPESPASVAKSSKPAPAKIAYEMDSSSDPTAHLTFNLSLSESEKSAREKVVLPFAKKAGAGQGKIIYEAEDEDDFDEEDPDDDLNI